MNPPMRQLKRGKITNEEGDISESPNATQRTHPSEKNLVHYLALSFTHRILDTLTSSYSTSWSYGIQMVLFLGSLPCYSGKKGEFMTFGRRGNSGRLQ